MAIWIVNRKQAATRPVPNTESAIVAEPVQTLENKMAVPVPNTSPPLSLPMASPSLQLDQQRPVQLG